jgi:hypothetical protein
MLFTSDLHRLWEVIPDYFKEFNSNRKAMLKETAINNFKNTDYDKLYIHHMSDDLYTQTLHDELKTYFKIFDIDPRDRTFRIALDGLSPDTCKRIFSILPRVTTAVGIESMQDEAIIKLLHEFVTARAKQGQMVTVFFGVKIPKSFVNKFDDHNLRCAMNNVDSLTCTLPRRPRSSSDVSTPILLSSPPPSRTSTVFFKSRKRGLETLVEEEEERDSCRLKVEEDKRDSCPQKAEADSREEEVSSIVSMLSLSQHYSFRFNVFDPTSTAGLLQAQTPPLDDFYFTANPFTLN